MTARSDMTIARLARAAGVGVETVRYYQRRGLMAAPKSPTSGYRTYDQKALDRLLFIRRAQTAGFTLEEIGELLALDSGTDRKRVRELAHRRIRALDEKIAELRAAQDALTHLVGKCETRNKGSCPIIDAFARIPAPN